MGPPHWQVYCGSPLLHSASVANSCISQMSTSPDSQSRHSQGDCSASNDGSTSASQPDPARGVDSDFTLASGSNGGESGSDETASSADSTLEPTTASDCSVTGTSRSSGSGRRAAKSNLTKANAAARRKSQARERPPSPRGSSHSGSSGKKVPHCQHHRSRTLAVNAVHQ